MHRPGKLLLALLWSTACIPPKSPSGESREGWGYEGSFLVETEASTEDQGALAEALLPMAAVTERVELRLRVQPDQRYRDGSEGWWVSLDQVQIAERKESVWSDPLPSPLQGLGVELRRFGDGEVLQVGYAEYLMGGVRGGESYDFLFSLISPHSPDLRVGQSITRRTRWPFVSSAALGWENRQQLEWTNHGRSERHGQKAWHLSYQGDWWIEGGSREPHVMMQVQGQGPVRGEVWLRVEDHRMLEHTFEWRRTLDLEVGTDEKRQVVQSQDFEGSLRWIP